MTASRAASLVVAFALLAAAVFAGAMRAKPPAAGPGSPPGSPGHAPDAAPETSAAAPERPPSPRVIASFPLPDGQLTSRMTVLGEFVSLSGSYGRTQLSTAVVSVRTGSVTRIPLAGSALDESSGLLVGALAEGDGPDDDVPLAAAYDPASLREVWRTRLGFCGGWFEPDGKGHVFATLQGGAGSDPLFVLESKTGKVMAGPIRTGGVVASVHLERSSGRALVSASGRVIVIGPAPAFRLEREIPHFSIATVDHARGRVFATELWDRARLMVLESGDSSVPRVTPVQVRSHAVAIDAAANRLYLAEAASGRFEIVDADGFETVGQLVVDPGATESNIAIDPEARRLYVAISVGAKRTLHVVDLGPAHRE